MPLLHGNQLLSAPRVAPILKGIPGVDFEDYRRRNCTSQQFEELELVTCI